MINKQWIYSTDKHKKLRLKDPNYYVRIEIEAALERNIPVIPLLIGEAAIPVSDELPISLSDLANRSRMSIRPGNDLNSDIKRLIQEIIRTLELEKELSVVHNIDDNSSVEDNIHITDSYPIHSRFDVLGILTFLTIQVLYLLMIFSGFCSILITYLAIVTNDEISQENPLTIIATFLYF